MSSDVISGQKKITNFVSFLLRKTQRNGKKNRWPTDMAISSTKTIWILQKKPRVRELSILCLPYQKKQKVVVANSDSSQKTGLKVFWHLITFCYECLDKDNILALALFWISLESSLQHLGQQIPQEVVSLLVLY